MGEVIDLPVKSINYIQNSKGDIVGVNAFIDGVDISFDRECDEKRYITELCIAWLALEEPDLLNFDDQG